MTELETITIAPDQDVYLVYMIEDAEGAGTMHPYGLATDVTFSDGQLTVLAGDDVLAVYEPESWHCVGEVWFAVGQWMVQRDGRLIICQAA
jgi:hypothetical protein